MRDMDLTAPGLMFTRNWFRTRNLPTFRQYVHPAWAGKPVVYLELGVFEGMSMCWMLQHVLTHPDSRAVGVDPWLTTTKLSGDEMKAVKDRAFQNVHVMNSKDDSPSTSWSDHDILAGKCQLFRANSAELLRRMVGNRGFAGITKDSVDISMVDGNHNALAVWDDCRLVWQLLKPGGWMLLDDVENDKPKTDHVKEGLGYFLQEFGPRVEFLWKDRYCECYKKVVA